METLKSCLSYIPTPCYPSKEFFYFDDAGALQRKTLNAVECFFRWAFGWYAETHLSTIAQKAYAITLSKSVPSPADAQGLLNIIEKATRVYGDAAPSLILSNYHLPSGHQADIHIRYNIQKDSADFYIRSVIFTVTTSTQTVEVVVNKDSQNKIIFHPEEGSFGLSRLSPQSIFESVKQSFESDVVPVIQSLALLILADSEHLDTLHYYPSAYALLGQYSEAFETVRTTELRGLGWKRVGLQDFYQGNARWCNYQLEKTVATERLRELHRIQGQPPLCMDFAVSLLGPLTPPHRWNPTLLQ